MPKSLLLNRIARCVVFRPGIVITLTLLLTVIAGTVISINGIGFDSSIETLALNDETLAFHREVRKQFGDDRVIIIGLTTPHLFTPGFIEQVDRLTAQLAGLQGIEEVQSITNVKSARREGDSVVIDRLIPRGASQLHLDQIKAAVTTEPLYVRHYVSPDGMTTAINLFINPKNEKETRAITDEVERTIESAHLDAEVLLAGVPVMDARGMHNMARDMLVCSPIAGLFCFFVFFISFRSFWAAALPMVALAIGIVWVLGLVSALDSPVTIATVSLPTVLIAVGGSYMFHIVNQYRLSCSEALNRDANEHGGTTALWLSGIVFIFPAIMVSGLTTVAGFGALASSSIPSVRDMGLFNAAGVLVMLVITLTFIPAVLSLSTSSKLRWNKVRTTDYAAWLNTLLHHLTAIILYRRRAVWIAAALLTVGLGLGIVKLQVNTDYLSLFPRSSPTVQSAEKLHERMAGVATVQVAVSGSPGDLAEPRFLRSIAELEQFALTRRGVDAAISVSDIVRCVGSLLYESSADGIPATRSEVESLFREYIAQEQSIYRLIDNPDPARATRAIVVLRTNLFSSNELKALTAGIEEWAGRHFEGADVRVTGSAVLLNQASDAVAESQATSLAIALATIYAMMALLFRSVNAAILALIPNLVPILCYFGFLGWIEIPLDITTSLLASAALGLAVDNAVHMIRRFRLCSSTARNEGWAMWLVILQTGKPMILANAMLIAAFLIFMLSSFVPVRTGGLLWAVTITACLGANLIFLPVLMKSRAFASAALGIRDPITIGLRQKNDSLQSEEAIPD